MKRKVFSIVIMFIIISTICVHSFAKELKTIKLVRPDINSGKALMMALKHRKSTRSFQKRELPMNLLSNLLWAAYGINRPASGMRTAPSAKNLQEIDIYVALKNGLYLYNAKQNTLDPILAEDIREHTGIQDFTQEAPINLIYVADFSKMGGSERDKQFYSAADTGFISQNVYLFCASEDLATIILGWVDRDNLEKIMKLKKDQKVILTQPVGYPKK